MREISRSQSFECSVLSTHNSSLSELLEAVLCKGLDCRFQAKGHSMSPFIKNGDVITVSPLNGTSPGLGDVAAFIRKGTGRLVIHRVVGKREDSYFIKGDNASEADGLVQKANILGFVTGVERKGKKVFIGLGPERFLIAFLTRRGLLFPMLLPAWRIFRPILRRFAA
jgi:signal peptidase I